MADQGRWFKLWVDAPDDDDLDSLDIADFGRWCKLGAHVRSHGTNGTVRIVAPARVLCAKFQVADFEALEQSIKKLPKLQIENRKSETNGLVSFEVTFRNWHKYQADFSTDRVRKFRQVKRYKKRREEKRSKNSPNPSFAEGPEKCETCLEVLAYLNRTTGRSYGLVGEPAKRLHARHAETSKESCFKVIDNKWLEWKHDEKLRNHVNLSTLFRPSNFDRYLNQDASNLPLESSGTYEKGDV